MNRENLKKQIENVLFEIWRENPDYHPKYDIPHYANKIIEAINKGRYNKFN